MRFLLFLLLLCLPLAAHAQKLQPSTGIMLTAPTDGAGNPCTAASPCSNTGLPQTTTAVVAGTTTITTGGTSQTVFAAGTLIRGGYITNPSTATENLYVDPTGAAATTTEAGSSFALLAGQTFLLGPTANAVTVNAATTGHAFSAVRY